MPNIELAAVVWGGVGDRAPDLVVAMIPVKTWLVSYWAIVFRAIIGLTDNL